MANRTSTTFLSTCLAVLLSGCQASQPADPAVNSTRIAGPDGKSVPVLSESTRTQAINMKNQVKAAILDLADRLQVPPNEISLVRADAVTWSDGSLGCPRKGMSYTQSIVPGTLIVLNTGGSEYEYHAGSEGNPVYCAKPRPSYAQPPS